MLTELYRRRSDFAIVTCPPKSGPVYGEQNILLPSAGGGVWGDEEVDPPEVNERF